MKTLGKKLVATLFGISAIGGVAAVASFGLTNCTNPQKLENIITDTVLEGPTLGDIPSNGLIWEWTLDANPSITTTNLELALVDITNKTENSCDMAAAPNSGFSGKVHLTYNVTAPIWSAWTNGSTHYDTSINLTKRDFGNATIHTGTTTEQFSHHYSFTFFLNDGTPIATPNMGGAATGYHFENLHSVVNTGYWQLDDECIWFYGSGQYPGLNRISFDVCSDDDSSPVISNMKLNLYYTV